MSVRRGRPASNPPLPSQPPPQAPFDTATTDSAPLPARKHQSAWHSTSPTSLSMFWLGQEARSEPTRTGSQRQLPAPFPADREADSSLFRWFLAKQKYASPLRTAVCFQGQGTERLGSFTLCTCWLSQGAPRKEKSAPPALFSQHKQVAHSLSREPLWCSS